MTPRESIPMPDPTALTTERLLQEIGGVKTLIVAEVSHLKELHAERFSSIATQFNERDTRTEQTSRDSKVAVDAALQAAKEAVGEQNKSSALAIAKSEAATTKQIDQIGVIIATMTNGLNDKIDDIKNRITAIEGRSTGVGSSANAFYLIATLAVAVAAVVFAILHR